MVDIERWMDEHDAELNALAHERHADSDTVRYLASLVLAGAHDSEIYERLRELAPSSDGQHSPLSGAPDLLWEIRRLVAAA